MKRTPLKRSTFKVRKTPVKALIKKADKLWGEAVRLRDKHTCQRCGKLGTNPHHIFTRSIKHMRHDLSNGVTLCPGCHTLRPDSAHKGPEHFRDWLIKYKGEASLKSLKDWSLITAKPDYNASILYLQQYIKERGSK